MKISEQRATALKEQRSILSKITTRRMKIADLENEIATLQGQLNNIVVPFDFDTVFTSEHLVPIPLPTAVPEKIRFGADGRISNYDDVEV